MQIEVTGTLYDNSVSGTLTAHEVTGTQYDNSVSGTLSD